MRPILGPVARKAKGVKWAVSGAMEGAASVTEGICRFPALKSLKNNLNLESQLLAP